MKDKVFGIGWAKTGTTTLGTCMKILGYYHQSQNLSIVSDLEKKNFARFDLIVETHESFDDWPWIIYYEKLFTKYPNAKFILTKRNSKNWLKSYKNMLNNQKRTSRRMNEIRTFLYGLDFPNVTEEQLINRFQRHNNEVLSFFKGNENQLLVVDWERGDGWKELCEFLGLDVPNESFPHSNKGSY